MKAEEYIKKYTKRCSNETVHGEHIPWMTVDGALEAVNLAREEMLEKALIREVKEDAGGYPYIDCESIELYDYKEDKPLAKPGQKVKIIVIIEDEK